MTQKKPGVETRDTEALAATEHERVRCLWWATALKQRGIESVGTLIHAIEEGWATNISEATPELLTPAAFPPRVRIMQNGYEVTTTVLGQPFTLGSGWLKLELTDDLPQRVALVETRNLHDGSAHAVFRLPDGKLVRVGIARDGRVVTLDGHAGVEATP